MVFGAFAQMPQRASIECNVCVRIPQWTRSPLSAMPRRCNARGGLQIIRNRTNSVREFPELDHPHSYFAALIRAATTHRLSLPFDLARDSAKSSNDDQTLISTSSTFSG